MHPLLRKRVNEYVLEHGNKKKFAPSPTVTVDAIVLDGCPVENARKEALDWVMEYHKGEEVLPYAESLVNQFFGYDFSTSYYEERPYHHQKDLTLCDGICSLTIFHNIIRTFSFRSYSEFSLKGWQLFIHTLKKRLELQQRNPVPFIMRIFSVIYTNTKLQQEMRLIYKALLTSFLCNDHSVEVNCNRWLASMEKNDYGSKERRSLAEEWVNYFTEYPLDTPLEEEVIERILKIVTC